MERVLFCWNVSDWVFLEVDLFWGGEALRFFFSFDWVGRHGCWFFARFILYP